MVHCAYSNLVPFLLRSFVFCLLLTSAFSSGCAQGRSTSAAGFSTDSGPQQPIRKTQDCFVVRIIDGDTFNCRDLGNVRLTGIDAPERDQRPMGAAATDALKALLPLGTTVQLEGDVDARDRNRRILAYVWANGRMVNWIMVRSGWTVALTVPPNVQYADQFRAAQTKAREDKLGLWKTDGFRCLPAEHRQKKC